MREQADGAAVEAQRWEILRQNFEAQITALHEELDNAQQTTAALDEQKQENLLLKETIDRMRFEMDEMRTNASATGAASGGSGSVRGSVSKSLGAELLSKMKQLGDEGWGVDDEEQDDEGQSGDMEEVSELLDEEDDTESEDVIQTIITRTKRVSSYMRPVELPSLTCIAFVEGRQPSEEDRDRAIRGSQGVLGCRDSTRSYHVYVLDTDRPGTQSPHVLVQHPNRHPSHFFPFHPNGSRACPCARPYRQHRDPDRCP